MCMDTTKWQFFFFFRGLPYGSSVCCSRFWLLTNCRGHCHSPTVWVWCVPRSRSPPLRVPTKSVPLWRRLLSAKDVVWRLFLPPTHPVSSNFVWWELKRGRYKKNWKIKGCLRISWISNFQFVTLANNAASFAAVSPFLSKPSGLAATLRFDSGARYGDQSVTVRRRRRYCHRQDRLVACRALPSVLWPGRVHCDRVADWRGCGIGVVQPYPKLHAVFFTLPSSF